jgi:phosphonate transport system substrate-binding protein
MICPHDTVRDPEGWQRMARQLAVQLAAPIHLAGADDFADFRYGMAGADLVYASSADALALIDGAGFAPLARPAGQFDEALVICAAQEPIPSIDAIHGAAIATVEPLLSTKLALHMLRRQGVTPARLAHRDSWLSVVRSVWNGELPFGIIYRDAYQALSPAGRAMVRVLASTDERVAFHMLCIRPGLRAGSELRAARLEAMGASDAGASALAAVGLAGWLPVDDAEIALLRAAAE